MTIKTILKRVAPILLACGVFTIVRLSAERIWHITYDFRTIELMVVAAIALHLLLPLMFRGHRAPSAHEPHGHFAIFKRLHARFSVHGADRSPH